MEILGVPLPNKVAREQGACADEEGEQRNYFYGHRTIKHRSQVKFLTEIQENVTNSEGIVPPKWEMLQLENAMENRKATVVTTHRNWTWTRVRHIG